MWDVRDVVMLEKYSPEVFHGPFSIVYREGEHKAGRGGQVWTRTSLESRRANILKPKNAGPDYRRSELAYIDAALAEMTRLATEAPPE